MYTRIFVLTAFLSVILFIACQKEISDDVEEPGKLVRIQQGTSLDLDEDTVYLLSYDVAGNMVSIYDSSHDQSYTATYNPSGELKKIDATNGRNATFSYDSGRLKEIWYNAGSIERFSFTYTDGVVSKKSYYSDYGSGFVLSRYYDYTVTDGNITHIEEYTPSGTLVSEATLTYSSQLNPFKELSLFNYSNQLGMMNVIDFDTYHNKNLILTRTENQVPRCNIEYTFNAQQMTTKIVNNDASYGGPFTWFFSYE